MKIGIVTFWQTQDNYGQILQCWALQQYLKSMGHDAYLIRYTHLFPIPLRREKIKKVLKVYPVIRKIYKVLFQKKDNVFSDSYIDRGFNEFKNKNLEKSEILYRNLLELQKKPPQADCYIVGSDQVWAQLLKNKNNEVFFLNFGDKNIKRISYAASFALQCYPQKLLKCLSKNLSRFDAISVREKSGLDICKKAGRIATLVLDPTLLIDKKFYFPFIGINNRKPYVFAYILNIKSPEEIYYAYLNKYFSSKGYDFIVTTASGFNQISFTLKDAVYEYPTIENWLSLIFYSKIVLTTSFHGVALSISLNKPFIFFPLSDSYAISNNRVFDLLDELELSNRILTKVDDFEGIIKNPIDWDKVNRKLYDLKQISHTFLYDNL